MSNGTDDKPKKSAMMDVRKAPPTAKVKGSFQQGGVVPETGAYQLHQGETVIPNADPNRLTAADLASRPTVKSGSFWDTINTPIVSAETIRKGTWYEQEKAAEEKAIKEGKKWKAGLYSFGAGVDKSLSELASSFTSPASIGLMAASGGESLLGKTALKALPGAGLGKTLLKLAGVGGAAAYGATGAAEAVKPQQPGETTADRLERLFMGLGSASLGAAGVGAFSRDALHGMLRRSLHLDEDLATKVADRVQEMQQTRQHLRNVKDVYKGTKSILEQQKLEAGRQLIADTGLALHQEQAAAAKPFHDIGEKIKEPVAKVHWLRDLITDAVKKAGGRPDEIPAAAFKALGPEGEEESIFIHGKKTAISELSPFELKQLGIERKKTQVSWSDLTRIREDLADAARASKDTTIKRGLESAHDKITKLQEDIAERKGLGDQYKKAKEGYFKFKRGIGSDLVKDWVGSYDIKDQAIAPKVQKLFSKSTSEALRNVLRYAGLDAGPLDRIVEAMGELKEQRGEELHEEKRLLTKARSTADIIPGTKVEELEPLSNEDLLRQRLQHQANNLKEAGVQSPFALMQYAIGIFQLARQSAFGSYHLARGFSQTFIPERIKTPEFQNWVMDKAGIEDRWLTKKITDGLYKMVRAAAKSGVPEAATATSGRE